MTMCHKAFVFDYAAFESELQPMLLRALENRVVAELAAFIEKHRDGLRHPDEGEPLGDDWQSQLASADVDAYADLALTRYYDPNDDFGLAEDWLAIDDQLQWLKLPSELILGASLECNGVAFDPGKMGSYFQSAQTVCANLAQVDAAGQHPFLAEVRSVLESGTESGLYVTF